MPSESTAQRRFMAMCEKGIPTTTPCPKMTRAQFHAFAATPEHGLPHHVGDRTPARDRSTAGSPALADAQLAQGYRVVR